MQRITFRSFLISVAIGLLPCACGPKVNSFSAEPNVICAGSKSRLTWDATTGGTLASSPETAGIGPVEKKGAVTVSPMKTTRFHLEVSTLFGRDGRDVDVSVQTAPSDTKTLGQSLADPSAGCDATSVWVTAVAPPNFWDAKFRVGSVASPDGRRYHVVHAGRSADVTPDAPSDAFQGVEVSGDWLLKSRLTDGEACGQKTPRSLMISVSAACSP